MDAMQTSSKMDLWMSRKVVTLRESVITTPRGGTMDTPPPPTIL